MRTMSLPLIALAALASCSEKTDVSVSDISAELVSCNGQRTPETMALYLDLNVHNDADEPIEVTRITLSTSDTEVVVSGSQTASPAIAIPASGSADLSCKDGFTLSSFPGDAAETAIRVQIDYRLGDEEGTLIYPATLRSTIAWDNCGTFLGNPVACHAE